MWRPLRSVLFVPGNRADRFPKAFACGADAVVIDLEDAVDPNHKAEARQLVGDWLLNGRPGPAASFVRINAAGSPWQEDDLAWLRGLDARASASIDAVVLPKAEAAPDLERAAEVAPSRRVIPLRETARGLLHAATVLSARAEVPAVLLGAEDLTAELGIPRTLGGEELLLARSQLVLAATAIGADPIDAVWTDLKATDSLETDARRAKALGFRGKLAVHPDQVAIINDVFTPTAEEIAAARRIVDAHDQAHTRDRGAYRLDDRMVDAPVVARARRVLQLAGSLAR